MWVDWKARELKKGSRRITRAHFISKASNALTLCGRPVGVGIRKSTEVKCIKCLKSLWKESGIEKYSGE